MLCVKCGQENPDNAKYCGNCNAVLPQQAPDGLPRDSTINLDESASYPVPQARYENEVLQALAWAVHDFLEEEGPVEQVAEAYDAFVESFAVYLDMIPELREIYYKQKNLFESDRYSDKASYLITQVEALYETGTSLFEKFFEDWENDAANPEELVAGVKALLDCNDHFALGWELNNQRAEFLGTAVEMLKLKQENPEEFQSRLDALTEAIAKEEQQLAQAQAQAEAEAQTRDSTSVG